MHKIRRSVYKMRKTTHMGKRRSLERTINGFLTVVIVVVLLPIFIATFLGRIEVEELILNYSDTQISEIETSLPGIVAKQIGISMPGECIKAQAVIARTNLLAAEKAGQAKPEGFQTSELQELWGAEYENYYKRLQELIAETTGETLQYNGDYIYAAYHQASAGNTRNMTEYAGSGKMPYLASTACHEDVTSEGYLNVYFWTKEDFLNLFKNLFPEEVLNSGADVQVLSRDSAGYVLQVQVGQTIWDGEEFRKRLSLPSACFELSLIEDDVRIVTMGNGHGFGLSQHTAEKMAEAGCSYQEILEYFYKGAILTE